MSTRKLKLFFRSPEALVESYCVVTGSRSWGLLYPIYFLVLRLTINIPKSATIYEFMIQNIIY